MQDEQPDRPHQITEASGAAAKPEPEDPRLDFERPDFDAELALQTAHLEPPVPDAPVLDNVSKFAGLVASYEEAQAQPQKASQDTSEVRIANGSCSACYCYPLTRPSAS